MKTKIIPFDLGTAKKIQAGEIKGQIKSREGYPVRIVEWDMKCIDNAPILALIDFGDEEVAVAVDILGKEEAEPAESVYDLFLEVLDNESQFKPFDKVLVRDENNREWETSYFSHIRNCSSKFYYIAGNLPWKQCIA